MSSIRFTPEHIESLPPNNIFVFGSNTAGRHGKFAALTAKENFGAIYFVPEGIQGQSYAIPTCDSYYKALDLNTIRQSINKFTEFAKAHPELTFWVTKLGCGSAGHHPSHVGAMFSEAKKLPNVVLPLEFVKAIADRRVAKIYNQGVRHNEFDESGKPRYGKPNQKA